MSNLDKHLISSERCQILANEYDTSNYVAINSKRPANKPDSREYIFELSVLKDYLNYIEDEMEKMGIRDKGIKVRLGKYPTTDRDPDLDKEYLGYQTIFFAPTELERDFQDNEESKAGGVKDLPGMNYGHIRPPY